MPQLLTIELNRSLSVQEWVWVWKIERLRRRLKRNTGLVEIVDYGAGTPGAQAVPAGRTITRSIGDSCRLASKSRRWCELLLRVVRAIRPQRGIELGTHLGLSAAYQAAALELNGVGELLTLEGAPALASLAEQNLRGLNLTRVAVVAGRFQDTLPGVLKRRVQYAFVDGHHDEYATQEYFQQIADHADPGAVLVFDDITWSDGMKRAWQAIASDRRVGSVIDKGPVGLLQLH